MGMGRYQYYQMMLWKEKYSNQPILIIDPKSDVREQFTKLQGKKGRGFYEKKNQKAFTR